MRGDSFDDLGLSASIKQDFILVKACILQHIRDRILKNSVAAGKDDLKTLLTTVSPNYRSGNVIPKY